MRTYVLPPRTTRGIPSKRYDPDNVAKRSRCPIDCLSEGRMSQIAMAFNTTLFSTKLSSTVEEALESDHWQKAMDEVINAL